MAHFSEQILAIRDMSSTESHAPIGLDNSALRLELAYEETELHLCGSVMPGGLFTLGLSGSLYANDIATHRTVCSATIFAS
mgnify:CR=1 FL=1